MVAFSFTAQFLAIEFVKSRYNFYTSAIFQTPWQVD